ncbi:MAG: BofC C-terminal domain-containing protein [Negativicutes bacterium]|nr:BofC C-terminal domain-containing protein [Negativicutes bacterium]
MLPFPKSAKQRIILASSIFAAAFVLAYYFGAFSLFRETVPRLPMEAEVAKDSKLKVTANTDLVQKILFLKCNDEEVYRTKPAENLVGLSLYQVQKVYNGWTIDRFDAQEVDLSLKVDSYCREHANNQFVGAKDGFVAVFYGKPGAKAIVKEITDIPLSRLSGEDVDELRRGLVVQSREDLLRTLEGMQSR